MGSKENSSGSVAGNYIPSDQEPEGEDTNDSNAYLKFTIPALVIIVADSDRGCNDLEDECPLLNHLKKLKLFSSQGLTIRKISLMQ
jgi:hypothetical protein